MAAIIVSLCERSLTRVSGSVTLAMDNASKSAWSEEGKARLCMLGERLNRRWRVL